MGKKRSSVSRNLLFVVIVLGGVVFICCASSVIASLFSTDNTPSPVSTGAQSVVTIEPTRTQRPANTPRPTASLLGTTRDQPFPTDAQVDIGDGKMLQIVGVTHPADNIVENGNRFNNTPVPGEEYYLITLRITCTKSSNEKCTFRRFGLHIVGTNGTVRDPEYVAGIPNEFDAYPEFFGGASIEGNLVFLVTIGDQGLVLYNEPFLFGDPVYIDLP